MYDAGLGSCLFMSVPCLESGHCQSYYLHIKYRRFGTVGRVSHHPKAWLFDELGMRLKNQLSSQLAPLRLLFFNFGDLPYITTEDSETLFSQAEQYSL